MNLIVFIVGLVNLSVVYCKPLPDDGSTTVKRQDYGASGITDVSGDSSFLSRQSVEAPLQPVVYRESAKLEEEGIPSKILGVYDNSQSKVGEFFHPKPLVDTIQEHEKYGNEGDKFLPVGRAIVNGYEGFSNFLNRLIDGPMELAKQFSRGITKQLNTVGGKIVGLV